MDLPVYFPGASKRGGLVSTAPSALISSCFFLGGVRPCNAPEDHGVRSGIPAQPV